LSKSFFPHFYEAVFHLQLICIIIFRYTPGEKMTISGRLPSIYISNTNTNLALRGNRNYH